MSYQLFPPKFPELLEASAFGENVTKDTPVNDHVESLAECGSKMTRTGKSRPIVFCNLF